MRESRLFAVMPESIELRLEPDGPELWHLEIRDRPAGVPWSDLTLDRYESLPIDVVLDVICAHVQSML